MHEKVQEMDVGIDSITLPWPSLVQLQKVLLLPWLLDSYSNIFRDLLLNDKIPKGSDNTKDHHFSFSSVFATLCASASPQALEFTFTTTFFTSSYYHSSFRFQFAMCINSYSFQTSFCAEAQPRCTVLTGRSHTDFKLQFMATCLFSASGISVFSVLI